MFGKQARLPFLVNNAWQAIEKLHLVHTDVYGPMKTVSLSNSKNKLERRAQSGTKLISKVYERCNVVVLEPVNYEEVAKENGWIEAMKAEIAMKKKNKNWELVNRPIRKEPQGFVVDGKEHMVCKPKKALYGLKQARELAVKGILRYIKGTLSYGVEYVKEKELKFTGFRYSDWVGSIEDMKSTLVYLFTLGSCVFSWSSRKQETVVQSTTKAKYIATTRPISQALWLRKLMSNLNLKQVDATEIYCDN
ncbi:hypothetical protein PVK06_024503 [Gossypium arboreum]|uniref:Retrovirus-related Pol polyprotein from transposon TNT 1-94 n=1 Tax=Gossypium arboreum TaxID=29729 RepID=A0ABR0PDX7_GOSAR|nr:hypothetical protein PVK06_024503 [Gossypium arboreum]